MTSNSKRAVVVALTLLLGVVAQAVGPLASRADAAPAAVGVQSFGASYGEWGARWWQWLLSIPAAVNPNLDTTGQNCAQGQYDNVWFLAGSFGGEVTRACTIPAGKAVFFPMVNNLGFKPKGAETLLDLRRLAAGLIDAVTTLHCTVDGIPCAPDLFEHRATTPSFTVIAPSRGLVPPGQLSLPGNTDSLVADGYWMLLTGFESGRTYRINFGATTSAGFNIDVTYDITVE